MVTIPPSLQALRPIIPLTEAQKIKEELTTVQVLTPEQQQQLQTYETQISEQQQVLSEINSSLQEAQQRLATSKADYKSYTTSGQVINPQQITAFLEYQSKVQTEINALNKTKAVAQQYLITSQEAQSYTSSLLEQERLETVYQRYQEARAKEKREFRHPARPPLKRQVETSDVVRYEEAGYSKTEAQALAQWSAKHFQTPSPEMAQQIIRGEVIIETPGEYDWMGQKRLPQEPPPFGRIGAWMAKTPIPFLESEFAKERAREIERGVMWIGARETPLEYISGKIVKYDIPIFGVPQPIGLGVGGFTYKRPSEVAPELWKARQEGEKVIEKLENIQLAISEGIRPIYKEERLALEKEISKYTLEIEKHNREIKELEQEIKEYEKNPVELKYRELLKKGERLDEEVTLLEKDYGRIENLRTSFKSKKKKVPLVVRLAQSVWVDFLSAPFGIASLGIGLAVKPEEEMVKQVKGIFGLPRAFVERPIETIGGIAGQLAFFGLTGYGLAKVRAIRTSAKIRAAIKTGEVKVKSMGVSTKSQIAKLKISAEGKLQMETIIRRGESIRKYDTVMKYPKKTKYTPDIKATYYEFMDAQGNIIGRISFGEVKATLKGKTIDRFAFSAAIEELSKKTGRIEGLAEVVVTKEPIMRYDLITRKLKIKYPKARKEKIFYEIETLGQIQRGHRIIKVETTSELLGTAKYKGEPLLKGFGRTKEGLLIYPEYRYFKGKGKPYTKGVFIEYGRLKRARVDLKETGRVDYFVKVEKGWDTFGAGVVEFIKEKPPKKTMLRGWTDEPISSVVSKYSKPKPFKAVPDVPIQKVSQWYGKQVLVPEKFTPSVITTTFASDLPVAFTRGGVWTGTAKGVGLGIMDISPEITVREELIEPTRLKIEIEQLLFQKPKLAEEQITRLRPRQKVLMKESTLFQQNLLIGQTPMQKQELKQVQKLKQTLELKPAPLAPPTPSLTPPVTTIPFIPFFFPGEEPKYVKKKPYTPHAYIEAKGVKPHWKKLDNRPLTYKSAMSVASEYVDENISARGKVVPMKSKIVKGKKVKPKKQAIDTKERYFEIHRRKFRTWKQVKGRRTALKKGSFIELQKFRLDKPMETKGIMRGWGKRRTPFGF